MGRWSVMMLTASAMLFGISARPSVPPAAPIAEDVIISVAPGDSVLIPYAGSDPDGDLFGFFRTSDMDDPSAGVLLDSCVCRGTYAGFICSCTTFFVANAGFTGSTTFTYRAVDLDGNESADATVTINSTVAARTPEEILDEIEFIIIRGTLPDGDIDEELRNPLISLVNALRDSLIRANFDAAPGQANALCKAIEVGIKVDRILYDAMNFLAVLCDSLRQALDESVCLADVTEYTWEVLITPDWDLDLVTPANSTGAIEVPFFTGTYRSASKGCVTETRCAGSLLLVVHIHIFAVFPVGPPLSLIVPSFEQPSTQADPVVHRGARQLHSHRWKTEAQSIPFAERVRDLRTLAEEAGVEGADSVTVTVLKPDPPSSFVDFRLAVAIEVDCDGGGVGDGTQTDFAGVAEFDFGRMKVPHPDKASFPCPEE